MFDDDDIELSYNSEEEFRALIEKTRKANELLDMLDIPRTGFSVLSTELYDLFMDEERVKILISKLRNKAFL